MSLASLEARTRALLDSDLGKLILMNFDAPRCRRGSTGGSSRPDCSPTTSGMHWKPPACA